MSYPIFTSRYSIGLTFVSWSYHWLCGHDHTWNNKRGLVAVPANPNTGINAHNFDRNHCAGYQEWVDFLSDTKNNVENCSMYGGANQVLTSQHDTDVDYADCLTYAACRNPLIFFVENPNEPWYFLCKRLFEPEHSGNYQYADMQIVKAYQDSNLKDFVNTYFLKDLYNFDRNIWDLREMIALNFTHLKVPNSYLNHVDRTIDHLYVDSNDLWYNGEQCLRRIFQYLGKNIENERLIHWRNIYREWQNVQLQILQFNWYLPVIVDSIIHNYNFNLSFLKLTLLQEAVIQGCLIQNHNLNLKCYGLKSFPNNTKDLHSILEESIHL